MNTSGMEPEDEDLTVRGDLETTSVPELLRSLLGSGETGILQFRNGEVKKTVYIHNGRVVYAASSNPDERLGESLLVRGKITARQYLEASKHDPPGAAAGRHPGGAGGPRARGADPARWSTHVREILMDLFTWTTRRLRARHDGAGSDDVVTLNISTENLILEGHPPHAGPGARIFRGIGGDIEAIPVPTGNTEVLYKLELTPEEQEVLAQVNGRSTIEQICQVSYLSNFETCRILWALQVLG